VSKPVLVYDGACEFCRRWIELWQTRTADRVVYLPLQQPGVLRQLGISRSDALRSVQLVTPDGRRYRGAEAVFRALEYAPDLRALARVARLPVLRQIAEVVYRQIARRRPFAARVDRWLFGRPDRRAPVAGSVVDHRSGASKQ
jgi:predicted DCC family thiol-disulfide oxidoreductase YuxK